MPVAGEGMPSAEKAGWGGGGGRYPQQCRRRVGGERGGRRGGGERRRGLGAGGGAHGGGVGGGDPPAPRRGKTAANASGRGRSGGKRKATRRGWRSGSGEGAQRAAPSPRPRGDGRQRALFALQNGHKPTVRDYCTVRVVFCKEALVARRPGWRTGCDGTRGRAPLQTSAAVQSETGLTLDSHIEPSTFIL